MAIWHSSSQIKSQAKRAKEMGNKKGGVNPASQFDEFLTQQRLSFS